jgi:UDP-glucuronate 4-epimerase
MKLLITGAAGFIGYHLTKKMVSLNYVVSCLDNLNSYYDVDLKYGRLDDLGFIRASIKDHEPVTSSLHNNLTFIKADIEDYSFIVDFIKENKFDFVVHLAAQAGVRYSLVNPKAYIRTNVEGFLSVVEGCRQAKVKHLLYASSSSVYGLSTDLPYKESSSTDHPVSLYAASKKSNELIAHTYSHLYNLATTGLRFFTVYGPWGRPDMALFKFTQAILSNSPIDVYNYGKMIRDFTYVEDIVEAISRLVPKRPKGDSLWSGLTANSDKSSAPYQIFNVGNSNPVELIDYIEILEDVIGKKAIKNFLEIQPGDVVTTNSCTDSLYNYVNFRPKTSVQDGVDKFYRWYKQFYL